MPININLLAEAQAAEELRRRDPAKRAIFVAILLVAAVLCWSSVLGMKTWALTSTLNTKIGTSEDLSKQYATAMENQKSLRDTQAKLIALNRFTTNRFLQANVLDNLLHVSVEGIPIVHLRTEQVYELVPETKPTTAESGKVTPGKPASAIEKIKLEIDAKDTSRNPGDEQITRYIQTLAGTPYFKAEHITTNNIQMRITGNLQSDTEAGKAYIPFNLEFTYPNRVR